MKKNAYRQNACSSLSIDDQVYSDEWSFLWFFFTDIFLLILLMSIIIGIEAYTDSVQST